jgi:ribosome recycling factor
MTPESSLATATLEMDAALENLKREFSSIRTGKASPALVENLEVGIAAYGSQMKLKELAVITTPEARMIMVQPFDPSTANEIDKALRESKLGFNPINEGRVLRIPIPALTEERRKEYVKTLKTMGEDARVRVRAGRKDGMDAGKKMKNDKVLTEDGVRDFESDIQEATDTHIKLVDELVAAKEKEVMTV